MPNDPIYTWRIENPNKEAMSENFDEILKAREVTLGDSEAQFDRFTKIWEMRIAFIEKVILLDTGTFALSLTFLASVGSHSAARSVSQSFLHTLVTAWLFLLFSILMGGIHNRLRMASITRIFLMNAALRKEYRTEDHARRFARTSSLLTGTLTPSNGEPLDLSVVFKAANDYIQAERKKDVDSARDQQNEARESASKYEKTASWMELGTILLTVAALLVLGKAAADIAWVFSRNERRSTPA